MRVERDWLRNVIFNADKLRRFTQDSPILPEVWLTAGVEYCHNTGVRVDLLLSPHRDSTAGALGVVLRQRLKKVAPDALPVDDEGGNDRLITRPVWTLSVSQTAVAVSLTLEELILVALPVTPWWQRNIEEWGGLPTDYQGPPKKGLAAAKAETRWMCTILGVLLRCAEYPTEAPSQPRDDEPWFRVREVETQTRATVKDYRIFEEIAKQAETEPDANTPTHPIAVARAKLMEAYNLIRPPVSDAPSGTTPEQAKDASRDEKRKPTPPLWSIGLNRRAMVAISRSVACTKADAARLLFNVNCSDLTWAVVDSGIASHQAFVRGSRDPRTGEQKTTNAIRATYDFTRLRQLITLDSHPNTGPTALDQREDLEAADRRFKRMRERLRSGRSLDWALLQPMLQVDRTRDQYRPGSDHGTHVAGILAGNRISDDDDRIGMCPDLNLIDLRVLDDAGRGDEFAIVAALQFIRYLNATADQPVIHGVNLSLSVIHDVENFACGRTPICEECERLVASGVVVVAAAGNRGFERVLTSAGELDAYRGISITDPGNAESVITVGATHRFQPHTYGVSYFSSRGPTGDGRMKPDVLAPGERITSALHDEEFGAKDGTSMAAPHVSGVAAMLMARHREFLGQPERVKRIIMKTATDLGRERYFQGAGMVDALRALQAV
jgi:subtilisin family serine protease